MEDAQQLRRGKQYDKALPLYRESWARKPESGTAAAIINCLRGLGQFDEAESFYDEAVKACAPSPWLKTEHVWTLYAKYIKPIETPDKEVFLAKAEEIMGLTNDLLPRKLTAFKVTDILAREPTPDWGAVRKWLESIRQVEGERPTVEPGKKLSDKRKWYFKYTKALAKLGDYDLCRKYCRKAQRLFKTAHFFSHRAAKCAKEKGDYRTARQEYEALLAVHDEWYVHMDFAELYLATGNNELAEQHVVAAILKCTNMQLKARTFLLWAQILDRLEHSGAGLPLHFYIRFRQARGWPVPDEAGTLAGRYPAPAGEGEPSIDEMQKRVEDFARRRHEHYRPKRRGVIKNLRDKFGFIRADDGSDVFFSLGSYRGSPPRVGLPVVFRMKQAYDRRKMRESFEAYDVVGQEVR